MNTLYQVVYICVVICGISEQTEGAIGYSDSTSLLQWAPLTLKSPYITFLNNFYYASWKTRNSVTKEAESLRHLQLPRGVPFSVGCGACFHRSQASVNLSISVTHHNYHSVPKMHNGHQKQFHVSYLTCLMAYAITVPIHTNGHIICTLKRGRQQKTETISFGVQDVDVDEVHKEIQMNQSTDKIKLHCPAPDQPSSADNPVIHVWHQDSLPVSVTADTHDFIIPQLQSNITLHYLVPNKDVICSVYNIKNPTKVHQTRYTISGSWTRHNQMYHSASNVEEDVGAKKLSHTSVGIIIAAVIICLIFIIMAAQHFVASTRKK